MGREIPRPFFMLESLLLFLILFFPPETNSVFFLLIVSCALIVFYKNKTFPSIEWYLVVFLFFLTLFLYPSSLSLYYIFVFAIAFSFFYFNNFRERDFVLPLWAISIYGIIQLFNWPSLSEAVSNQNLFEVTQGIITQLRIFSRFALPTTFGAVLGMLLPLVIKDAKKRKSSRALIVVMVILIILTRSLGAVLVAALSCGVFFAIKGRRKIAISILAISVLALAGVVILRGTQIKKHPSWKLRVYHWKNAVLSLKEKPVTGIGWRRFFTFSKRFIKKGEPESLYVHNAFLQFLVEGGIIPLLGVLVFSLGFRVRKDLHAEFLGAGAGWVLHNFIDIGFYFPSIALLGGIIFSQLMKSRKNGRASLVLFLIFTLSILPFYEKSRLENIKWVLRKGESIKISSVEEVLFSIDDEAQLLLYRITGDVKFLHRALKIYPENPSVFYQLSLYYLRQGAIANSEMMAKACLLLNPTHEGAKEILKGLRENEK